MRNYLLIDFGASLMHTHHSRVIRGFTELIEQLEDNLTLYLPMGSEVENVGHRSLHRKILIPSYHPVGFRVSQPTTWIPGLVGFIFRHTENTWIHSLASRILSQVVVRIAFLQIEHQFRDYPNSIVVFPTACPISLCLGKKIKKKYSQAKLVIRLTNTAEKRGYFTRFQDFTSEISQLIELSPADIRFGYEMEEYARSLAISESNLFFSPTPPCLEFRRDLVAQSEKTFGFLGMAQRHKGVNWLVEIVSSTLIKNSASKLSWIIQTENPPPQELLEISGCSKVTLLPGRISESDMSNAFALIDLICLPYDVESYKYNASALAYRAADNLTAVATFKGSAFANEIEKFGIGVVVDDLESLISSMLDFDISTTKAQIIKYNQVRFQSTIDLITW